MAAPHAPVISYSSRTLAVLMCATLGAGLLLSTRSGAMTGPTTTAVPETEPAWYTNPVIFADLSDPDVVRVDGDFFMVASSFHCVPGLPVLRSGDLVHWQIVGYALPSLPSPDFDLPQHGNGVWAPSIRHQNGQFWIYYGDPDRGIFLVTSTRAEGPWEPPVLVEEALGWIDPCPLWDDDGQMYLVHAWAKSRAGFNSVLTIHRLSPDGRRVLDEGRTLFDGRVHHPTIEGPKIYKREGFYYVFAPAGGVRSGWQTVLRSRSVFGPYEDRVVLTQGVTSVNGPHQGGWVETSDGESWFLHFQQLGAFGRVVHLQPLEWMDGWPVIGTDPDGDGIGEPVRTWPGPRVQAPAEHFSLQATDEFNSSSLGLQWQWQANPRIDWAWLSQASGSLHLRAVPKPPGASNLWDVPHLLLQKLPGPACQVTVRMRLDHLQAGEEAGLVVLGRDYSALVCSRTEAGLVLEKALCRDADRGSQEERGMWGTLTESAVYLRVYIDTAAVCRFGVSADGAVFAPVGGPTTSREGAWVGARIGVYCSALTLQGERGSAELDWFRVEQ